MTLKYGEAIDGRLRWINKKKRLPKYGQWIVIIDWPKMDLCKYLGTPENLYTAQNFTVKFENAQSWLPLDIPSELVSPMSTCCKEESTAIGKDSDGEPYFICNKCNLGCNYFYEQLDQV